MYPVFELRGVIGRDGAIRFNSIAKRPFDARVKQDDTQRFVTASNSLRLPARFVPVAGSSGAARRADRTGRIVSGKTWRAVWSAYGSGVPHRLHTKEREPLNKTYNLYVKSPLCLKFVG